MSQDPSATNKLVQAVLSGMREKKAVNLTVMDLRHLSNPLASWFILCNGTSDRQTQAIADSILDTVRQECKEKPMHVEGMRQGEWILIDYFEVVAHVFLPPVRDFYDLEGLWADANFEHFAE